MAKSLKRLEQKYGKELVSAISQCVIYQRKLKAGLLDEHHSGWDKAIRDDAMEHYKHYYVVRPIIDLDMPLY